MTLRLPCLPLKAVNLALGTLYFSDGSQKCLVAFVCWLALCVAADFEGNSEFLSSDSVVALAASLLRLRTVVKSSLGQTEEIDNAIGRIVKQNVDSRVQPVSSLAWCSILRSLGGDTTFEQAMAKYNSHPEVVAFEASCGSGAISLDNRKKQASTICFVFFVRFKVQRSFRTLRVIKVSIILKYIKYF